MEQEKKSMRFIKKVLSSVYGPAYYQDLIGQSFSYSLKYFAVFISVSTVVFILGFSVFYFPKVNETLNYAVRSVAENYPQELAVTVRDGNVSTNVAEPYFVKIPASTREKEESMNGVKNLIVIDTKSEASADNFLKYETLVLVTKNHFVFQEKGNKIVTRSLGNVSDVFINKVSVDNFIEKYSPYLKLLFPIFIFGLLIFVLLLVIFRLGYLFLAAPLIWLVAHIKGVEIGYGKSYQLGLHLMTLPLLLVSPFTFINFPFAFTLLLIVLAFVNIRKEKGMADIASVESVQEVETQPDDTVGQV